MWRLRSAETGKLPVRRTEIAYEAMQGGRACQTRRSPILPEPCIVNEADIWEEGYCSYPGRSYGRRSRGNPNLRSKACRKKSAEAVVPGEKTGKGRTIVSLEYRPEGGLAP